MKGTVPCLDSGLELADRQTWPWRGCLSCSSTFWSYSASSANHHMVVSPLKLLLQQCGLLQTGLSMGLLCLVDRSGLEAPMGPCHSLLFGSLLGAGTSGAGKEALLVITHTPFPGLLPFSHHPRGSHFQSMLCLLC